MGNSEQVAARHYLQVTDDHFSRASGGAAKSAGALHNALQQASANDGKDGQETKEAQDTTAFMPTAALGCFGMPNGQAPPRGVEPLSSD